MKKRRQKAPSVKQQMVSLQESINYLGELYKEMRDENQALRKYLNVTVEPVYNVQPSERVQIRKRPSGILRFFSPA